MHTLKEILAEPQTMYDGGMVRMAKGGGVRHLLKDQTENYGDITSGSTTMKTEEPIWLSPKQLQNIPGAMGEEEFRGDVEGIKYQRLRESIEEKGYRDYEGNPLTTDPIKINVNAEGKPFITEGNHRLIEAIESNRDSIPVEITYLGGSENIEGQLNPDLLEEGVRVLKGEERGGIRLSPEEVVKLRQEIGKIQVPEEEITPVATQTIRTSRTITRLPVPESVPKIINTVVRGAFRFRNPIFIASQIINLVPEETRDSVFNYLKDKPTHELFGLEKSGQEYVEDLWNEVKDILGMQKAEKIDDILRAEVVDETLSSKELSKKISVQAGDFKTPRKPELQEEVTKLETGEITGKQYRKLAKKELPINPINEVPELDSFEKISAVLKKNQRDKGLVGFNRNIKQDRRVESRLDINAYNDYDTWVVTLTDKSQGARRTMYGKTAVLKNVEFKPHTTSSLKVAKGKPKAPFATIEGDWQNISPEDIRKYVIDNNILEKSLDPNNEEWIQVGFNPERHGFFYTKSGKNVGQPVFDADLLIQIGELVLARNVKKPSLTQLKKLKIQTTPEGVSRVFNKGGQVIPMYDGGMVRMADGGDTREEALKLRQKAEQIEVPEEPTSTGTAIVEGAKKLFKGAARKAIGRIPLVGLFDPSPAGEGSTIYTPEQFDELRSPNIDYIHSIMDEADDALTSRSKDTELGLEAAYLIDAAIGHKAGTKLKSNTGFLGIEGFGIMVAKPLEEALRDNSPVISELEKVFSPVREKLRKQVGNTIILYRAVPKSIRSTESALSDRQFLSYTADLDFAKYRAGVRKAQPLFTEDQIVKAERKIAETGTLTLRRGVYLDRKTADGVSYIQLSYDDDEEGVGEDYDSVREFFEEQNKDRQDALDNNVANEARIVRKKVSLDDVLWVTDRAGQTEFLVKQRGTGEKEGGQVIPMYDGGLVQASAKPMYDGGLV